ncbi:microsomal glutathione S-transferase 3 [Aplysia californica]|uniref:Microsomal glutathione S-transferase 3 n=1 Tax=Aplysia californica TaxID=6500 RepID=A0ABM0JTN9_APLCA|nr:microsomal glutathione S-transferase 3 [Aplysia californica]
MSSVSVQLSSDFGYVILTAAAGWVFLQYLAWNVIKARKKYDVQYPTLYSEKSKEFNCFQRAHQHTLEVYPQFLIFLVFGGLELPKLSSVFGILFFAGRYMYAQGYYRALPVDQNRPLLGYVGFFGVYLNSIYFALKLLGVV